MSEQPLPSYAELEAALERAAALVGAAESHGLLCGLVCGSGRAERTVWMDQVLADIEPDHPALPECRELLGALFTATVAQLNDSVLDFALLLPDDREPLGPRAEAAGKWCLGFLYGLGLAGVRPDAEQPEEVGEVLRDMSEIARVQSNVDSATEEEEAAYAEIVEYLRVGVLLVNEELQPVKAPPRTQ